MTVGRKKPFSGTNPKFCNAVEEKTLQEKRKGAIESSG